jgi:hypothetical protein
VVVGDIALLEPGEIVPCDGVFLSGHNVRCDESGATGESDAIKKVSYDECVALRRMLGEEGAAGRGLGIPNGYADCFIISGSKVLEGVGSYVVVAVGQKSFNGRILMGQSHPPRLFLCAHKCFVDSASRQYRAYSFTVQDRPPCSTHRENWHYGWRFSLHGAYDPVLRPAWQSSTKTVSSPTASIIHMLICYQHTNRERHRIRQHPYNILILYLRCRARRSVK